MTQGKLIGEGVWELVDPTDPLTWVGGAGAKLVFAGTAKVVGKVITLIKGAKGEKYALDNVIFDP